MMSVVVFENRVILEMRCRGSGRTCASSGTASGRERCDQRWSWTLWLIKHSLRLAERAEPLGPIRVRRRSKSVPGVREDQVTAKVRM